MHGGTGPNARALFVRRSNSYTTSRGLSRGGKFSLARVVYPAAGVYARATPKTCFLANNFIRLDIHSSVEQIRPVLTAGRTILAFMRLKPSPPLFQARVFRATPGLIHARTLFVHRTPARLSLSLSSFCRALIDDRAQQLRQPREYS